jgi:hypothetical protein
MTDDEVVQEATWRNALSQCVNAAAMYYGTFGFTDQEEAWLTEKGKRRPDLIYLLGLTLAKKVMAEPVPPAAPSRPTE